MFEPEQAIAGVVFESCACVAVLEDMYVAEIDRMR